MNKILVATDKPFAASAVNGIRKITEDAGYELRLLEKYTTKAELLEAVADVEAMIIRSDIVDAEVLAAARKLKIVVRAGAGYDNIDLAAATVKGVVAMNTPGQNSNAVAELALGMMVYMARGAFNGASGTELKGKTIGIHAYGNVGRYVAKIALGFGMKVYAFDPYVKDEAMIAEGVTPIHNVEELYKTCQYISLHIPANDQTKKSIGKNLLSLMPKGATLVNTARKEVIDEEGLLAIFEERPDFRYLSDIEPGCKAEVAEKYTGRFFFTPKKMGAQTSEANNNAGLAAARQIVGFLEKGDKTYQVNK
ncbi:MAG TPA: 3-phosphoglycerate dehydrogenase [Bacteroidales bacterium]|nr:MAG: 3-phosphoglycerate dehydrogenase [Bacteroidetes bacterium GWE2_42_24]OFY26881.1 MAG: 3-phosphoglycerate dehydrogenase [Bacteroidetes bacterium GWF2_43_11]PKP27217.1 MAG: 3-phosphoglycerate dehydrogenase [Bacteroidetes bacterium HGW-Bacteroidetes-22]HAQ64769.1 3-phosphoglycerate dehydrogenase [Bacteroidales bacterium]HBZ67835.1 3-phosphoglycerate dehydrogenase [Bacteroidales bacterium]